jgi:hypothetical protein
VYWRDDALFYPAEITGFDTGTGRHQVLYDDGAALLFPWKEGFKRRCR